MTFINIFYYYKPSLVLERNVLVKIKRENELHQLKKNSIRRIFITIETNFWMSHTKSSACMQTAKKLFQNRIIQV